MHKANQSKRRSKLLAASAMALTLTLGGGLLASGSAFAAAESSGKSAQVQSQSGTATGIKGGGHFGHRGGGFGLAAYESKLAAYLKLDEATLRTKLQTQTLAEIALAQGISRDTLKAQLVAWIDESKAAISTNGSQANGTGNKLAQVDSSTIADKLLDAKGGMAAKGNRGPGGARGFGIDPDKLAAALNLTADQLKEAAQSGKTLAELAEAQGVSRDTLKAELVAWIEAAKPAASGEGTTGGNSSATQTKPALDASAIADKLLDSPYGLAGKNGHGFAGMKALDSEAIATALGLTADELKTSLQSGKTLADLATEQGVDVQKVIDALTAAMKSQLDEQLSAGKITQEQYDKRLADVAAKASDIVNGKMGLHGKPGRPAGIPDRGGVNFNSTADGSSK